MAKARALTYEELMAYALKQYSKGGDAMYECWDERTFSDYVEMFGPITKSRALEMFRLEREIQRDRAGWY